MHEHLQVLVAVLAFIALLAAAFKLREKDPETNCMGCGVLYRPSTSDAKCKMLFHGKACEDAYKPIRVK
jgi:hypothetical protein